MYFGPSEIILLNVLQKTRSPIFTLQCARLTLAAWTAVALLLSARSDAFSQPSEGKQYEIVSIEFEGNHEFGHSELMAQISTKQTPGFFDKFLYKRISERLGRKDEHLDLVVFEKDIQNLREYYVDHGYIDVRIDSSLVFSDENSHVDITIIIDEGYRSIVDTLAYRGIVDVPEFVYDEIRQGAKIQQGDPFNRSLMEEEVGRVRLILWSAGYANAGYVKDSSAATYRTSTRNVSMVLSYNLGRRFFFGPITIHNELDSVRTDITDDVVLNQLDYKPMDIYSEVNRRTSERNLNRVGIFDQGHIDVTIPDNRDTSLVVKSLVTVRPKDKHELAPELGLSDENNAFNLGIGLGYTSRNFFGGARIFSTHLRFRTQTIGQFPNYFGVNTDAVATAELTFEVMQPYIFSNKIKGSWAFSLIRDKQVLWRQDIIRNRFGFTDRFAEFTTGLLDWTLERVSLIKNPEVRGDPNDPEFQKQVNQLTELEKSTQFNSILSFTIQRDKSNDLFSPSEGFIHTATFEESGILPYLLKNAQPDLPFTQFYRVILLERWYFDLSAHRFSVLGLKLKAGFEEKYGESRSDTTRAIPTLHRFYAGGAGSVRGWESQRLGATGDPLFGGNLAFEGSVELRHNLFHSLKDDFLDKVWIVIFVDIGNVWGEAKDFEFSDIAVAAGLGFRYDTIFGPFRIDYGFRVFDPAARVGKQWITQRKFFGETLPGALHFGIGQAF